MQKAEPVRIQTGSLCLADGYRGQLVGLCQAGSCFPFGLDCGSRRSKPDLEANFAAVLGDILRKPEMRDAELSEQEAVQRQGEPSASAHSLF